MRHYSTIFCILILTAFAEISAQSAAYQQSTDTVELEDVTISILPFREKYLEAAGGLVSLDVTAMEFRQVINNSEVINMAPGVFIASGTHNTNRLVIRGIGSRTPYGTNRIRAYLGDIPLTSGDGVSTLEDIDIFSMGRIEILKGPSSALYGSGLGGVVKITPAYPAEQGFTAAVTSQAGSFSTLLNNLSLGFKQNRFSMQAGVSLSSSEGFRENSEYRRRNTYLDARYFGKHTDISAIFSLVEMKSLIPSSLNADDFINNPQRAAGNWLAVQGYEEYTRVLGGVSAETALGKKMKNRMVIFTTFSDPFERRPFNVLDERSVSAGIREILAYEATRVKVSVGIEYFNEGHSWQIYETLDQGTGELESDNREKRRYANTFALLQWKPVDKMIIDAGLNLNLLHYEVETLFRADSSDRSGRYNYDPVVSPRIGLSYRILPLHYLYLSTGHGFSAPSLEETLLPDGAVNTELKPETGWNSEIGIRGRLADGLIFYDLTSYIIYLQNMLVTERLTEDIFTGINAGSALNTGVEFLGHFNLIRATENLDRELRLILGYTLSDNRFLDFTDDGVSYAGNMLPGIPRQVVNATLAGSISGIKTQIQYRYTGSQWMDDGNINRYGGYHLTNLQLSWSHAISSGKFGFELFGGMKNVFNTKYASMILVNAPSFSGSQPRYYYPGMPRQLFAGIILQIN